MWKVNCSSKGRRFHLHSIHFLELPLLEKLYEKGLQNKIEGIKLVNKEDITKLEPHLKGLKAIFSPETGIVDFSKGR